MNNERRYCEIIANEFWKEDTESYSSCMMKAEEAVDRLKEEGWVSPTELDAYCDDCQYKNTIVDRMMEMMKERGAYTFLC